MVGLFVFPHLSSALKIIKIQLFRLVMTIQCTILHVVRAAVIDLRVPRPLARFYQARVFVGLMIARAGAWVAGLTIKIRLED